MTVVGILIASMGLAAAPDLEVSLNGAIRSIEQARQIVRALPQRGRRPVVIRIRGGEYRLAAPIIFGPEESGAPSAQVIWEAAPGERPVFSGGETITGWTVTTGGAWTAQLPEVKAGIWNFTQVWVNGVRRYRSRWPRDGYAYVASGVGATPANAGKGWDRVKMFAADLPDALSPGDEVLVFHLWHMNRHRLRSVDRQTGILTFTGPTALTDDWANYRRGDRVIFENVRNDLRPGEWRLDRAAGNLWYFPLPGERIDSTVVIAPRLHRLMVLQGDVDRREWVHDLEFRELTFHHANWSAPEGGYSCAQAESALGGAIDLIAARDIAFRGCDVSAVGEYAFDLNGGTRHVDIAGCALHDLGAGGIKIGEFRWGGRQRGTDDDSLTGWVTISDSTIAYGGRMHPAACGILIGHSPHNTVERNEIADFYYSGISAGWSWGYGPSEAHHNTFRNNHIHDLGQSVLSDMGGIYTLGISPGTVIAGNVFSDITSFEYGGWGVYFDEGSTGILAERNWAYRCSNAGFHQHYGRDNVVRNNVFALNRDSQLMRTRAEGHRSFSFVKNIILADGGPLVASDWSGTGFESDRNLWWDRNGKPAGPRKDETWDQWKARGFDLRSVVADPEFRDPDAGDFRLKAGSPAAKIGFTATDLRSAGPRKAKKGEWRATVPSEAPAAYPPGVRAVLPVSEDFEESAIGDKAPGANTFEDDGATARVTASGNPAIGKCLSFIKATTQPQPHAWNPYVQYDTGFDRGVLTGRFAVKLEPGASFNHEWRDTTAPGSGGWYTPGVSISIGPDGLLTANGERVGPIPTGEWCAVEVRCAIGAGADGSYAITVRRPSAPPGTEPLFRRTDLKSAPLQKVTWWGFVAAGTRPGPAFALDAFSFGPASVSGI